MEVDGREMVVGEVVEVGWMVVWRVGRWCRRVYAQVGGVEVVVIMVHRTLQPPAPLHVTPARSTSSSTTATHRE